MARFTSVQVNIKKPHILSTWGVREAGSYFEPPSTNHVYNHTLRDQRACTTIHHYFEMGFHRRRRRAHALYRYETVEWAYTHPLHNPINPWRTRRWITIPWARTLKDLGLVSFFSALSFRFSNTLDAAISVCNTPRHRCEPTEFGTATRTLNRLRSNVLNELWAHI